MTVGAGAAGRRGPPQVAIYHNIVWPKYKGAVFSALHELAQQTGWQVGFVQVAQTEGDRVALSGVDLRYHTYPFELLFEGAYDAVPRGRLARTLFRHVLRNPARLVVMPGYHRPEYWAMLLACLLSGKRRAVFCDSTGYDKPRRTFGGWAKGQAKRLFFSLCDGYFCYGTRSAAYLLESGARADHIYHRCQAAALPIGFNADSALARRVAAREADPSPRFLYVGRLSPEKDLPTLLRAFKSFRDGRGATDGSARLVLVGAGPLRAELEAQAQALGLGERVEFTGALDIDRLSEQYARALCLVLPSTSEPWGLVVNEALHHGCPVVVSEACGCRPELVIDGTTGYAHAVGDAAGLAQALGRAVDTLGQTAAVGVACQRVMTAYTPRLAAWEILGGCARVLGSVR
jgi:glycosyltransferase involved in cell wall biosynthesis